MLPNPLNLQKEAQALGGFDFANTCRVCILSKGQVGLFAMNQTSKQLMSAMFNIKVDDGNPWKICVPCLNSINMAAEFKEMARKSDYQVKLLLQTTLMKVESEEQGAVRGEDKSEKADEEQVAKPTVAEKLRKNVRVKHFNWSRRDSKRSIMCLKPGCGRLFVRRSDMKKHYNYSHLQAKDDPPVTVTSPPSPPPPSPPLIEVVPEISLNENEEIKAENPMPRQFWTKKGFQRTIPCSEPGCLLMFSRERDRSRHHNHTHLGKYSAKDTTMPVSELLMETEPVEEVPAPTEDVKDVRIHLIRCDEDKNLIIKSETTVDVLPCKKCQNMFTASEMPKHLCTESVIIKTEPPEEESPPISIAHSIFARKKTQPSGVHRCELCHIEFAHFTQLLEHRTVHHPPATAEPVKQFKCFHCPKVFTMRWLLVRHLGTVHGIAAEKTKSTTSTTTTPAVYAPRVVNGRFLCCGLTFMTRKKFLDHRGRRHPEQVETKSCFCNICLTKVESRKALAAHYKKAHEGQRSTNRCNWCEREFSHPRNAFAHKRKVHPELFEDCGLKET